MASCDPSGMSCVFKSVNEYGLVELAAIARWISPLIDPELTDTALGLLLMMMTLFGPVERIPLVSVSAPLIRMLPPSDAEVVFCVRLSMVGVPLIGANETLRESVIVSLYDASARFTVPPVLTALTPPPSVLN